MSSVQDIFDAMSDYGFTDTSSIRKLEKINSTVWDICGREAWPFLEQTIDLTFDGVNPFPTNLPVDLVSVLDVYDTSSGRKMQPLRLQEADADFNPLNLTAAGTAGYYYFLGMSLRFAQLPPAGTVLRMRYIRKHPILIQTSLETDILIPREHHEAIEYGSLVKLYDLEDDTDLSVRFQQLYENKLQNMRQSIWMRQYDRPDHIVVVADHDLWSDYQ